jgi:hypothetical protein
MRRLSVIATVAGLLLAFVAATADACYCGAARHRCCKERTCCQATPCCQAPGCCEPTTCQEVVYEEKQMTLYKTVYKEVMDKVVVNAVKYVEETEYRCCPCTVMQPKQANPCEPAKTCAPAACAPEICAEMVPVQILKKVPHTVYRCVCYQKTEERPRVVVEQEPYTVTICVPKVVCKPVDVCSPAPLCCAPKDGGK